MYDFRTMPKSSVEIEMVLPGKKKRKRDTLRRAEKNKSMNLRMPRISISSSSSSSSTILCWRLEGDISMSCRAFAACCVPRNKKYILPSTIYALHQMCTSESIFSFHFFFSIGRYRHGRYRFKLSFIRWEIGEPINARHTISIIQ